MAALHDLTLMEVRQLLERREVSPIDVVESSLRRIDDVEQQVGAFISVDGDLALEMARQAGASMDEDGAEESSPIAGIPMQVKDSICTRDLPTTCASRMLEGFRPGYDATAVEKLFSHRAILLGKGNMDEFAMGSSTETSTFHPTHNPWDLERVPGGSSGGGAAAVAAGEAYYALGSDTGGSVRQPASLCGVVGLKPTYGLVSRYGLIAFASSLDQIGPITRDVSDCALVLSSIVGHDSMDSTSISTPEPDYVSGLTQDVRGLRLGVPREYFVDGVDSVVEGTIREAISLLEGLGANVEEVNLPTTPYALACYYILALSECSANLARYDGAKFGYSHQHAATMWEGVEKTRQFGFGEEVKRRIMLGTFALSAGYYDAYYLKAQKVRTLIRQEFDRVFEECDALVTPTAPTPAFPLGERKDDPVRMYLGDIYTVPASVAGIPAISVPCGFSQGLPVGMQIIGPSLSEGTLLNIGYAYEQATTWHKLRPPL